MSDIAGQFEDRGRPQAAVQMIMQRDLGRGAQQVQVQVMTELSGSRGRFSSRRTCSRSSDPNAIGSSSRIDVGPAGVSTTRSGPPCSHNSCRHRPHGSSTSPSAFAQLNATSRPPPVAINCETTPHSAHSVTPYAAFSTLQPNHHPAVVDQTRRPHRKLRVRRVRPVGHLPRRSPAAPPNRLHSPRPPAAPLAPLRRALDPMQSGPRTPKGSKVRGKGAGVAGLEARSRQGA